VILYNKLLQGNSFQNIPIAWYLSLQGRRRINPFFPSAEATAKDG